MVSKRGFTFIDLILAIGIIGALAALALFAINPLKQLQRARDSKRKSDLATLQRVLEDWYNDKGCYPRTQNICYLGDAGSYKLNDWRTKFPNPASDLANPCFICGRESSSPDFRPYLEQLPCSPTHIDGCKTAECAKKDYIYERDSNSSCPQSYKIYSQLENLLDSIIKAVDCVAGICGPDGKRYYQYGVASPNTDLSRQANQKTCVVNPGVCNVCITDANCAIVCISPVYNNSNECCLANPGKCP